jgi:glutamate racemase
MTTCQPRAPIGVFDSGIGGLSVLKALRAQMPQESFVYFADSAHNPYGNKSDEFVIDRSRTITQQLIDQHHIKALVVACNTATAAAIHVLRVQHPGLPIIGVEPALKPAVASSRTQRIAVLATRGTLASEKFLALQQSLASQAEFICTPCDGLADLIERSANTQNTTNLIAACAVFTGTTGVFGTKNGLIDTLVLGCTHYPLVLPIFRQLVGPDVTIVDNGQAIARRVAQLVAASTAAGNDSGASVQGFLSAQSEGKLTLLSSLPHHELHDAAARWL